MRNETTAPKLGLSALPSLSSARPDAKPRAAAAGMARASSPAMRKPLPVSQIGRPIATAKRKPAIGVAMKFCTTISADCMRPFARSSWSRVTRLGTTVVVALSKTVSPIPNSSTHA